MPAENLLFYGDNLEVLRLHIKDESVDLVYLDPPFKSDASYNVLFAEKDGKQAAAQIQAFEDAWSWDQAAAKSYDDCYKQGGPVAQVLRAFKTFLGTNDMLAYLSMMAPRLVELRRVLKPAGSIYLHCDPTASHYLKLLMDAVFGGDNWGNEIIWRRTTTKNDYRQGAVNWPRVHDVLLYYNRSTDEAREAGRFRQPFTDYDEEYIETFYSFKDATGKRYRLSDLTAPGQGSRGHPKYEFLGVTRYWRYSQEKMEQLHRDGRIEFRPNGKVPRLKVYLDDAPGVAVGDVWTDIRGMHNLGKEMLGYPTQKPLALLERIIEASSSKGDVVLDPFCGCGTTIAAAHKLDRRWIGIDITHLAIGLIKTRLRDAYGVAVEYEVIGEPTTTEDAAELARTDKFQFQAWALWLVEARPSGGIKKGADKGIDGRLFFRDGEDQEIIISVKGGGLKATDVRDLRGVIEREKAAIGVLISFDTPTKQMRTEAASAEFYTSTWNGESYPRLQLLTVADLLEGKTIQYPRLTAGNVTFKKAPKVREKKHQHQADAFDGEEE